MKWEALRDLWVWGRPWDWSQKPYGHIRSQRDPRKCVCVFMMLSIDKSPESILAAKLHTFPESLFSQLWSLALSLVKDAVLVSFFLQIPSHLGTEWHHGVIHNSIQASQSFVIPQSVWWQNWTSQFSVSTDSWRLSVGMPLWLSDKILHPGACTTRNRVMPEITLHTHSTFPVKGGLLSLIPIYLEHVSHSLRGGQCGSWSVTLFYPKGLPLCR